MATGRFGYAFDRVLIYGKGGAAFTRDKLNAELTGPFAGTATGSFDRTGWVAGAGIEHRWTRNWAVKLEYLHYDLGGYSTSPTNSDGSTLAFRHSHVVDVARIGLTYRP